MNVENSFCLPVYNRFNIMVEGKIQHPVQRIVDTILCQQNLNSFEIVVVDFYSSDNDFSWLRSICPRTIIMTLHEPFNLGRGRMLGATVATGKRLFILDCDMLLPPTFINQLIPDIDAGKVVFPLYYLTHKNGKIAKPGSGWGNVAMLKSMFNSLQAKRVAWSDKTTYGGEDTAFANPIVAGACKHSRPLIEGFVHMWHPKDASSWYSQQNKDK